MNKKALLVISFGTSYAEARVRALEAIETDLRNTFPDRCFYRAWTSGRIRKKLLENGEYTVQSLKEALEQMEQDGIRDILVQFTYVLRGEEYERSVEILRAEKDRFERICIGAPLVSDEADVERLTRTIEEIHTEFKDTEMLALMGHGSAWTVFPAYEKIQEQFRKDGYDNVCLGTVEFEPGIQPVLEMIRERRPERVVLAPLLIVAGDHALNDMAGEETDSWRLRILKEGPQVDCILKGLGEYEKVCRMFTDHAKKALEQENLC